ncbi:MAG TPA: hypothetical protein VJW23_20605, partial [Propionibacteriaceae bacterium]|nr:hypothetical protein [Propionibacteriaceae bacterium]
DDSIASSAAAAYTESNISINNVYYRDAGGSLTASASYYPWYVQDRADRKYLIAAGINYGNIVYDQPHHASAWSNPQIHVLESLPRRIGLDTLTLISGDLYVVRLPITAGEGWSASATQLMMGIAAAGVSLSTQVIGLYDLGNESVSAPTTMTRIYQNTSMNFTINANTIHTASPGALNVMYPRTRYFAAICVVGTTGPAMYGSKAAAGSPLLDPQSTVFPLDVGKLTGQSGLPSSITLSSLVKSDFVPWFALRPTAYG